MKRGVSMGTPDNDNSKKSQGVLTHSLMGNTTGSNTIQTLTDLLNPTSGKTDGMTSDQSTKD